MQKSKASCLAPKDPGLYLLGRTPGKVLRIWPHHGPYALNPKAYIISLSLFGVRMDLLKDREWRLGIRNFRWIKVTS